MSDKNIYAVTVSAGGFYSKNLQPTDLKNFYEDVKTGTYKVLVEKIKTEQDKEVKEALKKRLPIITPSAYFPNGRRGINEPFDHSGYIGIDVDLKHNLHLSSEQFWQIFWHIASIKQLALLGFESPSGGFFIMLKINPAQHLASFLTIERMFKQGFNINIDPACKDTSRVRFASYAPVNNFWNNEALTGNQVIEVLPDIAEGLRFAKQKNIEYEPVSFEPGEHDKPKYFKRALARTEKKQKFDDGFKHAYTTLLAANCLHFGCTEGYAVNMILQHLQTVSSNFDAAHHETTIKDIYKRYNAQFGDFSRFHKIEISDTIHVQRYVSEAIQAIKKQINLHNKLVLQANTGTGKTFALVQIARQDAKEGKKTIITMPLKALVEQAGKEYKLPAITGDSTKTDILEAINSDVVLCTFDSLTKLKDFNQYCTIVDECHTLADQYNFRAVSINNVQAHCNKSEKVIYTSATPKELYSKLGFVFVRIVNKKQNTANVHAVNYTGRKASAVINHITENWNNEGRIIVKIDDKKNMEIVYRKLLQLGYTDVVKIHSTSDRQRVEPLQKIIDNGQITAKITLTTSVINDGINIYNEDIKQVILVDERNPDAFVQFVARMRKIDNLEVYSYRKDTDTVPANRSLFYENGLRQANEFLQLLPQILGLDKRPGGMASVAKSLDLKSKTVYYNEYTNQYEVNHLHLLYEAETLYNKSLCNDDFYNAITSRYEYIKIVSINGVQIEAVEGVEEIRKEIKAELENLYMQTVDALDRDTFNLLNDTFNKTIDVRLKTSIKAIQPHVSKSKDIRYAELIEKYTNFYSVVNRYVFLVRVGLKHSDSILILTVHESNKNYGLFVAQLGFLTLLHRFGLQRLQDSTRLFSKKEAHYLSNYFKLLQAVDFEAEYTPDDLQRLVNRSFKVYHSKSKATLLLQTMFNLQKKSKRVEDEIIKIYIFKNTLTLEILFEFELLDIEHYKKYIAENIENLLIIEI